MKEIFISGAAACALLKIEYKKIKLNVHIFLCFFLFLFFSFYSPSSSSSSPPFLHSTVSFCYFLLSAFKVYPYKYIKMQSSFFQSINQSINQFFLLLFRPAILSNISFFLDKPKKKEKVSQSRPLFCIQIMNHHHHHE
ncbi:hypothetical protein BDA99DRAFT_3172 [Phascolomyces articulosus]|uniref:Transmembrane protein n=1 Tax=Phascolomyces articulosus TaxID=60185 RepID=A0AAD5PM18_9FUNG|nr:hypothetical protein BDA99DRAFT_3172 [Phascolomyces articulosus]